MAKFDESGAKAETVFLSEQNITQTKTLRILEDKYNIKITPRTLKKWIEKNGWEEKRIRKYISAEQIEQKVRDLQVQFLDTDKPEPQQIYALNVLMKTLQEQKKEDSRLKTQLIPTDDDEITRLLNMRETLITTIENNVREGKMTKDQLDELQKLDVIIQSSKRLIREGQSERRVFMFCYDGKDHTRDVEDANN